MKRRIFAVAVPMAALLLMTVPWVFIGQPTPDDADAFPAWVYYVLVMDIVFAVSVAWMLHRFWDVFANPGTTANTDPNSPNAAP